MCLCEGSAVFSRPESNPVTESWDILYDETIASKPVYPANLNRGRVGKSYCSTVSVHIHYITVLKYL